LVFYFNFLFQFNINENPKGVPNVVLVTFFGLATICRNVINQLGKTPPQTVIQENQAVNNVNLMYSQIASIAFYTIIGIGFFIVLPVFGIKSETMFAMMASFGLALALSSQTVLTSVWGGVIMLFNKVYNIDDNVSFSIGGATINGKIKEFNLLYTKIADHDTGNEIMIPNNLIYNNNTTTGIITNQSIVYK